MIRRCLIVDTETTGLDPAKDAVIEIGCILYSVEHQTSLVSFSSLIPNVTENPCENINRIPSAALAAMGAIYYAPFSPMIDAADVLVAHNADFDQSFLRDEWRSKPWACTRFDFAWPRQMRDGESLATLVLAHGIGVMSAHRALTDCQLIAALFDRMTDLPAMFARAMRPKGTFVAMVSYDDREKAKAAGFQWEAATKRWFRRMAIEDAAALPFKTLQLAEGGA